MTEHALARVERLRRSTVRALLLTDGERVACLRVPRVAELLTRRRVVYALAVRVVALRVHGERRWYRFGDALGRCGRGG